MLGYSQSLSRNHIRTPVLESVPASSIRYGTVVGVVIIIEQDKHLSLYREKSLGEGARVNLRLIPAPTPRSSAASVIIGKEALVWLAAPEKTTTLLVTNPHMKSYHEAK